MARREVIEVPGLPHHSNPIPNLVKLGNMVFSSAVAGYDSDTQELREDPATQAVNVFRNIRLAVEAAGGTIDDIAKITVFMRDMAVREHVNREWLKMYPDENDRPARHSVRADIPERFHVQLEFVAVL